MEKIPILNRFNKKFFNINIFNNYNLGLTVEEIAERTLYSVFETNRFIRVAKFTKIVPAHFQKNNYFWHFDQISNGIGAEWINYDQNNNIISNKKNFNRYLKWTKQGLLKNKGHRKLFRKIQNTDRRVIDSPKALKLLDNGESLKLVVNEAKTELLKRAPKEKSYDNLQKAITKFKQSVTRFKENLLNHTTKNDFSESTKRDINRIAKEIASFTSLDTKI